MLTNNNILLNLSNSDSDTNETAEKPRLNYKSSSCHTFEELEDKHQTRTSEFPKASSVRDPIFGDQLSPDVKEEMPVDWDAHTCILNTKNLNKFDGNKNDFVSAVKTGFPEKLEKFNMCRSRLENSWDTTLIQREKESASDKPEKQMESISSNVKSQPWIKKIDMPSHKQCILGKSANAYKPNAVVDTRKEKNKAETKGNNTFYVKNKIVERHNYNPHEEAKSKGKGLERDMSNENGTKNNKIDEPDKHKAGGKNKVQRHQNDNAVEKCRTKKKVKQRGQFNKLIQAKNKFTVSGYLADEESCDLKLSYPNIAIGPIEDYVPDEPKISRANAPQMNFKQCAAQVCRKYNKDEETVLSHMENALRGTKNVLSNANSPLPSKTNNEFVPDYLDREVLLSANKSGKRYAAQQEACKLGTKVSDFENIPTGLKCPVSERQSTIGKGKAAVIHSPKGERKSLLASLPTMSQNVYEVLANPRKSNLGSNKNMSIRTKSDSVQLKNSTTNVNTSTIRGNSFLVIPRDCYNRCLTFGHQELEPNQRYINSQNVRRICRLDIHSNIQQTERETSSVQPEINDCDYKMFPTWVPNSKHTKQSTDTSSNIVKHMNDFTLISRNEDAAALNKNCANILKLNSDRNSSYSNVIRNVDDILVSKHAPIASDLEIFGQSAITSDRKDFHHQNYAQNGLAEKTSANFNSQAVNSGRVLKRRKTADDAAILKKNCANIPKLNSDENSSYSNVDNMILLKHAPVASDVEISGQPAIQPYRKHSSLQNCAQNGLAEKTSANFNSQAVNSGRVLKRRKTVDAVLSNTDYGVRRSKRQRKPSFIYRCGDFLFDWRQFTRY